MEALVADFEDGLEARFGGWDVDDGSDDRWLLQPDTWPCGTALVVSLGRTQVARAEAIGEVARGPRLPMGGRDLVAWRAACGLSRPRGDPLPDAQGWGGNGRQYSVMPISSATPTGPPLTVTFIAPEEWTQVEIRLEHSRRPTPETTPGWRL